MKKIISFIVFTVTLFSCGGGFIGSSGSAGNSGQQALQGSYATLLTVGDYLYAINEFELATFSIKDARNPVEIDKKTVGFRIENIYHSAGVLFIGSSQSLHIFKIDDNGIPQQKSETSYFRDEGVTSCDPVIVKDQFAFVTLSSERMGPCGRRVFVNELRIYNVEDITHPSLLSNTVLNDPKGLGIDGNYLFVCEANDGVAVLDVSDPNKPEIIDRIGQFESYDLIVDKGLLMVVGPDEIRQYDYTDINNIIYLSSIDI